MGKNVASSGWCACGAVCLAAWAALTAPRPFELVAAGRTQDAHPATCALETADGWRVETSNAVAAVSTDSDHPLFADRCVKLVYRAAGRASGSMLL